ncbi:MAG TPA: dihydrolipoamide acetyltransferase family protein [Gemmatimonadales bacterium]|jgi:pyruvate dehydrogenase E2 component (dihydrolipoamide acetyltransferase)|nr:dihydrolipoamide acetyltransferase family protein [Gemmatimonadales bacterium]
MSTKVVMEALSPTMEEGRLVEWKKQEGEAVAVGDVLAEVETDKAVMELVARAGGTLLKHIVEAGATVPVSEPVAVIGEPGEDSGAAGQRGSGEDGKRGGGATPQQPAKDVQATQPAPDRNQPTSMPPAPSAQAVTGSQRPAPQPRPAPAPAVAQTPGRVRASPLARRIAAERGLDLGAVAGSGPEGRIVARDIEQATSPVTTPSAAPAVTAPRPRGPAAPPAGGPAYTDVPLTQIRKTIAKRLAQSIGPIPTFYLTTEVDMERVAEAREALESKVSFNDIILKAVAMALRQHPACNAWWQDDHIRYWNEIHVSMAVAVEEGLITPVIRHADAKTLRQISAESHDLAARARERRLKPEEYTGGTFSVSNLGMLDIDEFTAVINPPEAGILAVGRIAQKPVAHEGGVALRRRLRLTMSCDHRVIDGATGAQFLKTLKTMLENPLALVW